MILPDVNMLVFAYHADDPNHEAAKQWLNDLLNGNEPVGIPWAVSAGFVRVMTNPRAIASPMSTSAAVNAVESWFRHPHVTPINPGARHLGIFRKILNDAGGRGGNLVPDAHIAAIAMEHGAEVHSNDSDFGRFPGLRWRNPLA